MGTGSSLNPDSLIGDAPASPRPSFGLPFPEGLGLRVAEGRPGGAPGPPGTPRGTRRAGWAQGTDSGLPAGFLRRFPVAPASLFPDSLGAGSKKKVQITHSPVEYSKGRERSQDSKSPASATVQDCFVYLTGPQLSPDGNLWIHPESWPSSPGQSWQGGMRFKSSKPISPKPQILVPCAENGIESPQQGFLPTKQSPHPRRPEEVKENSLQVKKWDPTPTVKR
ncbi:uncharacterized protein [Saccopteryx bilineata]|uniref:uncharacterized protein n=1 Tax=Saccopteryx bilineata TaxID=59482 RepID=UPI00338E7213